MDLNQESLLKSQLFSGMSWKECCELLTCLGQRTQHYQKDEFIQLAGASIQAIGFVLRGSVKIIKEDYQGNLTVLASLEAGEIFGEAIVCAQITSSPVSVVAAETCQIMFLDFSRILSRCEAACLYHNRLIENMLRLLATKNLYLNQRLEILSARSIREKLLTYLGYLQRQNQDGSFRLPFNREELADFLGVNRSALSREISHLKAEKILQLAGNKGKIVRQDISAD